MTKTSLAGLIQNADLSNLKHAVFMENDTSSTSIIAENEVKLLEIKEDGLTLEVPINSCACSHNVTLYLARVPLSKTPKTTRDLKKIKFAFDVTGKIEHLEKGDSHFDKWTISVVFTQYDVEKWKNFVLSYAKRQECINKLRPEIK